MLEGQKTNGPSKGTMPLKAAPWIEVSMPKPGEVEQAALLLHSKEKGKKTITIQLHCLGLYSHGRFCALNFLGLSTYL